jgi:hypothetical protein
MIAKVPDDARIDKVVQCVATRVTMDVLTDTYQKYRSMRDVLLYVGDL